MANFNPERIEQLIKQGLEEQIFPGAAIAVGDKNGELYRAHFGKRAIVPDELPLTEDTLFDIASVTKIVSPTMVALKLIDTGRLSLDDTMDKFFSTAGINDPAMLKTINVKHLMTHTSGISAHIHLWDLCKTRTQVPAAIFNLPLKSVPGEKVSYSCLGYILLGMICEKVAGIGLATLADNIIFAPLQMKRTGYNPKANPKINPVAGMSPIANNWRKDIPKPEENFAATEYDKALRGRDVSGEVHDENAFFIGGVSGNAGIFSTIGDMSIYARMLANRGSLEGVQIISKKLFDDAVINHTDHNEEGRGLGFAVKGRMPVSCGKIFPVGSYGHTGFTGTCVWVDCETSQYVVLLTNRVHFGRENNKLIPFRSIVHNACAEIYRGI